MPEDGKCPIDRTKEYPKIDENEKKYAYIKLKKHAVSGLYANEGISSTDKERLQKLLLSRDYKVKVS